jgi:hypothetical protein
MGSMVKRTYIGVFIEVKDENFQEIKFEDDFYKSIGEENFMYPYQGLETLNVLIPLNEDFQELLTDDSYENDFVITEFNPKNHIENFKKWFKDVLAELETYFKDFEIKYGLVSFWDEF